MNRHSLVILSLLLTTQVYATENVKDVTAVKAADTGTAAEDNTTALTDTTVAAPEGNQTESSTDLVTNSTTIVPVTELIDLMTYTPEGPWANGGDPFVSPGGSKNHTRHVKAHDGFHDIKKEPVWAHWNDVFSTASVP